jgi:hypothetical protein
MTTVTQKFINDFKKSSLMDKIQTISNNNSAIQYLDNPDDVLQMIAISGNIHNIKYIRNPSESTLCYYIANNGDLGLLQKHNISLPEKYIDYSVMINQNNVKYVKNVSYDVLLEVVKYDGYYIRYIANPSDELKLAAIQNYPGCIKFLKNVTLDMYKLAVECNPHCIKFLKKPTEDMMLAAVKEDGLLLRYIKNPTKAVQLAAIRNNGQSLTYVENPTNDMLLAAAKHYNHNGPIILKHKNLIDNKLLKKLVKISPEIVVAFPDADENIKMIAIKKRPTLIKYIENPSIELKKEAIRQNFQVIVDIKPQTAELQILAMSISQLAIDFIRKPCVQAKLMAK